VSVLSNFFSLTIRLLAGPIASKLSDPTFLHIKDCASFHSTLMSLDGLRGLYVNWFELVTNSNYSSALFSGNTDGIVFSSKVIDGMI
jgi:hypothetical protein